MIASLLLALLPARQQDVVIYIADDVGLADQKQVRDAGHLRDIEALAAAGLRFTQTRTSPVCSQTRQMIVEGRWRFYDAGLVCGPTLPTTMPDSSTTLAEIARGAGLATAIFGKWHMGPHPTGGRWEDTPAAHGFDYADWTPMNLTNCGGAAGTAAWNSWPRVVQGLPPVMESAYAPEVLEQSFLAWWATTPSPRFAIFAIPWAHGPMHWPPAHLLPPGYPTTGSERPKFLAEIAAVSLQVGRLRAAVGPATTFIYVSDNGTPANVSPLDNTPGGNLFPFPAKGTSAERGIRVDMILAGPGVPFGAQDARMASTVDILPTVAALLGASVPAGLPGRDLLRPQVRLYTLSGNASGLATDDACAVGRFGANALWKLRARGGPGAWSFALYDLDADPFEHTPLMPQFRPAISQFLLDKLAPELP